MKSVVVHCGMTKTGSTALQLFMRRNAEAMRKKGLFYPESPTSHMSHFPFIREGGARDLLEQFDRSDCETLIISDENLYKYYWAQSQTLLGDLSAAEVDVEAVVYIRAQPAWIQSIYQQFVTQWEHRFTGSIGSFLKYFEKDMNYWKIVSYLSEQLGFKVRLRSYEAVLTGSGVVNDFFEVIGTDLRETGQRRTANPSMSHVATEIVREINTITPFSNRANYDALIDFLKRHTADDRRFGFLTEEECDKLWRMHRDGNERLAAFMPEDHYSAFCAGNWPAHFVGDRMPSVADIIATIWRDNR